jgi:hypothetical protein
MKNVKNECREHKRATVIITAARMLQQPLSFSLISIFVCGVAHLFFVLMERKALPQPLQKPALQTSYSMLIRLTVTITGIN